MGKIRLGHFALKKVICPNLIADDHRDVVGFPHRQHQTTLGDCNICLQEALYAVRLYLGFRLEGNRFGKSPITPKNVVPTMVSAEANQALKNVFLTRKNLTLKNARTVISMTIKKAGCSI